MVHWDDVKAKAQEFGSELAKQKIGIMGISLILLMLILGMLAPYLAPGADANWDKGAERWRDKPKKSPPVWVDYLTVDDYAHHHVQKDFTEPEKSSENRRILTFTKDMDSDVPPRGLFLRASGEADDLSRIVVRIKRPNVDKGGDILNSEWTAYTLKDVELDENGEFSIADPFGRKGYFKEKVREKGRQYLTSVENVSRKNVSKIGNMGNPVHIMQGKPGRDMLTDPKPLKGEYQINVTIYGDGVQVNEDETSITWAGAVYGVMGTDSVRRDIWQGWLWGARWGLIAGGLVAIVSIVLSTTYGMTSAYFGGWVDEAMSRLHEIIMGIPTLPILIILLLWRRSIWMFILVYSLLMWRGAARVVRARGLQVAQDTYIEAAEALGSGSGRIIRNHMIPQILPYSFAQAALLIPIVIMAEAGLHILGLGDESIVTWGTLLNDARAEGALTDPGRTWWWVLLPGVGMVLVGFGFIATGMAVERIINPKMQQR